MLSPELLFLITQHLSHRDYVSLMNVSRRMCALLYSQRFLLPRTRAEEVSVKAYQRGLDYLRHHHIQNYDEHMNPTEKYFRWFHGYMAIDIFDQVWTCHNTNKRWEKIIIPFDIGCIKKIFASCYIPVLDSLGWFHTNGYFALTYEGHIISWADISEREKERGDIWKIIKDVQAEDMNVFGVYFAYRTHDGRYFLSDMHDEVVIDLPLRDVHNIIGYVNDDTSSFIKGYLDSHGDLYLEDHIASSVKQVDLDDPYPIQYLHHSGLMMSYDYDEYHVLGVNVKFFLDRYECYLVTYSNELHKVNRKTRKSKKIMSFPRAVRSLQQANNGDWIVEYEK